MKTIAAACAAVCLSAVAYAEAGNEARAGETDVAASSDLLSASLAGLAARYAMYHGDAQALASTQFSSVAEIDDALERASAYGPDYLTQGWVAYGALTAAQNPDFVAAVREAADHYGREAMIAGLTGNLKYASQVRGGDVAALQLTLRAHEHAGQFETAATVMNEQAYDLQATSWAEQRWKVKGARLARFESAAETPLEAPAELVAALEQAGAARKAETVVEEPQPRRRFARLLGASKKKKDETPTVQAVSYTGAGADGEFSLVSDVPETPRSVHVALTLAALSALDVPASDAGVESLLSNAPMRACIKTARLNHDMCVVAAGRPSEAPFCLGQHALAETSDCFTK